jgi:hypothetical protein
MRIKKGGGGERNDNNKIWCSCDILFKFLIYTMLFQKSLHL